MPRSYGSGTPPVLDRCYPYSENNLMEMGRAGAPLCEGPAP